MIFSSQLENFLNGHSFLRSAATTVFSEFFSVVILTLKLKIPFFSGLVPVFSSLFPESFNSGFFKFFKSYIPSYIIFQSLVIS